MCCVGWVLNYLSLAQRNISSCVWKVEDICCYCGNCCCRSSELVCNWFALAAVANGGCPASGERHMLIGALIALCCFPESVNTLPAASGQDC